MAHKRDILIVGIGPEAIPTEIIYFEKVVRLLEAFDFKGWIIKTQLL